MKIFEFLSDSCLGGVEFLCLIVVPRMPKERIQEFSGPVVSISSPKQESFHSVKGLVAGEWCFLCGGVDDPVCGVDQETRFGSEFLSPKLWLRECKKVQVDLLRFHSEFPPPKVLHNRAACVVFNGVLSS